MSSGCSRRARSSGGQRGQREAAGDATGNDADQSAASVGEGMLVLLAEHLILERLIGRELGALVVAVARRRQRGRRAGAAGGLDDQEQKNRTAPDHRDW